MHGVGELVRVGAEIEKLGDASPLRSLTDALVQFLGRPSFVGDSATVDAVAQEVAGAVELGFPVVLDLTGTSSIPPLGRCTLLVLKYGRNRSIKRHRLVLLQHLRDLRAYSHVVEVVQLVLGDLLADVFLVLEEVGEPDRVLERL